jgi:N-acetylglucosaminyldiphosphoundecaprenol N-acetyl-beta-D-mannosaminyltransferase
MNKTNIFGYEISNSGLMGDVDSALKYIRSGGRAKYMACANPHSLVIAAKDPLFCRALQKADILLPDGSGILIARKILHLPLKEKVTGTGFFLALSREANAKGGMRFFFLGSSDQVLRLIRERIGREFPAIEVCGTYSPPFKAEFSDEENLAMVQAINDASPDVLWVGMTAPKQEKWIYKNKTELQVPFVGAIGAVFDFYAGTKKRSSAFWQRLGLEWLPRFMKEPRRLWERNLKSTPIFLSWVVKEKLKAINNRSAY